MKIRKYKKSVKSKKNEGDVCGEPSGTVTTEPRQRSKRKYTQLHLDLGQSSFASIVCKECKMRYTPGSEKDEEVHQKYHNSQLNRFIPFKASKHDQILEVDKISGDLYLQLSVTAESLRNGGKVQRLINKIEDDFQSQISELIDDSQKIYACISKSTAIGFLVLESVNRAMCMRKATNQSAKEVYTETGQTSNVECGVVIVWVHETCRKQGIASRLLTIAKRNFVFGYDIPKSKLCFKQPVDDGHEFAFHYCNGRFCVY